MHHDRDFAIHRNGTKDIFLNTPNQAACWVDLNVDLMVDDVTATTCATRVALPVDKNDNPWARRGDAWRP